MRSRHYMYGHQNMAEWALQDWIVTGTAIVETSYISRTTQALEGLTIKGYTGPVTRRLDPRRVAFNHRASSFEDSPKIVQSIKTLGDIAKLIEDEELPEDFTYVLKEALLYRHYVRQYFHEFEELSLIHI